MQCRSRDLQPPAGARAAAFAALWAAHPEAAIFCEVGHDELKLLRKLLTDASLLSISVQLLPSAVPSRPAGSGKMSRTARLQKFSTFRRPIHLPTYCLFVGVSLVSFWPQATEEAGQEAPQALGHAAGHLRRLTLRLPRDDTDVSWTSPLFSRSGSQCPAGLQRRNA